MLSFFIVSFNGFCIYFLLELLLQEILLIVRNFSHSKESDSFITLVYMLRSVQIYKHNKCLDYGILEYTFDFKLFMRYRCNNFPYSACIVVISNISYKEM